MDYNAEQRSIITLHLLGDIGPRRFGSLVAYFGSATAVLQASENEITAVEGMTPALASVVAQAHRTVDVEKELERAAKAGARIYTCSDDGYPAELRNLSAAPPVVYVLGAITTADVCSVALVGSRRPTPYGKSVASQLSRDFVHAGVTTVSGLARGIDSEVHAATLTAGGRTIAVLGNGLNVHYPPENRTLADKIAARGALVSEFPMDFPPDRPNFPRRNRIISGLALATVVVEADIKSGALITAGFALEQGKDVFAVPGSIYSKYSAGPHSLLKQGAHLAQAAEDVLEVIQPLADWRRRRSAVPSAPEELVLVDGPQKDILAALEQQPDGVSVDGLSAGLAVLPGELAKHLLDLELRGLIRCLPGKVYIKNQELV
jgi:DNA processing protein